jgi:hypothetical protein
MVFLVVLFNKNNRFALGLPGGAPGVAKQGESDTILE